MVGKAKGSVEYATEMGNGASTAFGTLVRTMWYKQAGVETDFLKNARKLAQENSRAGHNYWDSKIEMAARAFACYVKDKLAEQGYSNDYLCGHADISNENGTPVYPQGEERKTINKAFDVLFAELRNTFFK